MTDWLIALGKYGEGFLGVIEGSWEATGILFALLLVMVLMRHQWASALPYGLYSLLVLGVLMVLDALTGDFRFMWVYLIVFGFLHDRMPIQRTWVFALLFFVGHTGMKYGFDVLPHVESIGTEVALFVFFGWVSGLMYRSHARAEEIQQENRHLLDKVDKAHSRLHEYIDELEETSRRDYLTGLYNFGGFQEQVTKSLSRCMATGHCYHVVCVDLVDFQQVNMREGIDAGDQLLVQIARQLKKNLPPLAQVARYDGDQFVVGLTGDESALRFCLETVENVIAGLRAERSLVNVCIGTATYPAEAQSASELIRLAEHRLSIEQKRIRHQEEERRRHLEKLSAVGQLAAGLAHEIRNPLTSIRGFIQISATESPEVKRWESIMLPEIDRINDLLKQFLHLSETRPARHTLFNLDRLIDDVLQLLHPKAILMGHELTPQPPSSPVIIEADAEQLKQVLINLVQNGLEALADKGVVCVRWKEMRDRISIRVQDSGSGIPPEYMSRIFDPFFTTKGDGTGMGLSICHRIISEHGGQIHVTSQPGRGTTFNIHLPIRQVMKNEDEQGESAGVPLKSTPTNRSEVVDRLNMLNASPS
ncbi:ATP-binding protein [Marininema halotolerans]|uniref:histidine kinase n=1 Tax=Marininema halotolerans TaxID=1155944 RepID=A0A1I6P8L3_9BACL|nr:ATP-binding protein [Marininema halotolerans]SFS36524.1 diguanylate cyclase (GGDEF) domain-containing protein [Marininema halotolerans]